MIEFRALKTVQPQAGYCCVAYPSLHDTEQKFDNLPSQNNRFILLDLNHGTRLFYELLSCGDPCRGMGRGGWPAMRSRHQWIASLGAAKRSVLTRPKPTGKIDWARRLWVLMMIGRSFACHSPVAWANAKA